MALVAGVEQASEVVSGTFSASGASAAFRGEGPFNVSIGGSGWSATVALQRSFDGGTTWLAVSADPYGTAASFTAPADFTVSPTGEIGLLYRLNCTFTSGTIPYRLSR